MNRLIVKLMNLVPEPIARRLSTDSPAAKALRPFVNRLVPTGPVPVVVSSGPAKGLKLLADLSDEKYYLTGAYEQRVQVAISCMLRRGMTFWDVGSHAGFFAVLARSLVGSEGLVRAFEPMPENRARLLRACELNGFTDIVVHSEALGDRVGERKLLEHGSSSTWGMTAAHPGPRTFTVSCTTLDMLTRDFAPPDLVKIDVEGSEVEVLRGGADVFQGARTAAIVEFHSPRLLTEARSVFGDHLFERLDDGHWLMRHREATNSEMEP